MTDLYAVARTTGVPVEDQRVTGRPYSFAPVGTIWHYTATAPRGRNMPTLNVCKYGRSDLPGPLCHYLLGRDGTIAVITDGNANHAGLGAARVLAATRRDLQPPAPTGQQIGGNPWYIGVEMEAGPPGYDYTPAQRAAGLLLAVAISQQFDHGPNTHIGHSEWTTRKIDPGQHWPMDTFRTEVARRLNGPADFPTPPHTTPNEDWFTMASKEDLREVVRDELDRARLLDLEAEYGTIEDPNDGYGEKATKGRLDKIVALLAPPLDQIRSMVGKLTGG